jgi:hypothetical protein
METVERYKSDVSYHKTICTVRENSDKNHSQIENCSRGNGYRRS